MRTEKRHIQLMPGTFGNRLGVLFVTFLVMLIAVSFLGSFIQMTDMSARNTFLATSTLQSLLVFIFPAWLSAWLTSGRPMQYLGISDRVTWKPFVGAMILMGISLPAMNVLVVWNEGISLPASMSAIEETLRTWEDTAAGITRMVMSDTSVWGLISGILVVGLLTGFAEEMFFRAGLQRALVSSRLNRHVAVWTAAFIFSTIHFQFFGFVPRLLIGAAFGYMYCWTGSVWVPAFAHALNNSSVVVFEWLKGRGLVDASLENFGVEGDFAFTITVISLVLTLLFVMRYWDYFFNKE